MPSLISQIILFLSSYAPLFVVFGLLDSFAIGCVAWIWYIVAAVSAALLVVAVRTWKKLNPTTVRIARARHRDADAIGYLATYLIPLAGFVADSWASRTALVWFLVLVGVLYVRAHLFYVNPLLSVAGYRVFEVETESGRTMLVISKKGYLRVNDHLDLRTLSDYIFLDA